MIYFTFEKIPQSIFCARIVYISTVDGYFTLSTAYADFETEDEALQWLHKQEQIRLILHKEILKIEQRFTEQEIATKSILEMNAKIEEFKRQAAKELIEMKERRDHLLLLAAPSDDFIPASEEE